MVPLISTRGTCSDDLAQTEASDTFFYPPAPLSPPHPPTARLSLARVKEQPDLPFFPEVVDAHYKRPGWRRVVFIDRRNVKKSATMRQGEGTLLFRLIAADLEEVNPYFDIGARSSLDVLPTHF